jgi:hypothetical protein
VDKLLGTLAAIVAVAAAGIVSYMVLERLAAERPALTIVRTQDR